jgi:peptidoglycan L-alanyl-D-glutamate endopeptidase CwlK
MSAYTLGAGSLAQLNGVHKDLVAVVHRAIQLTTQDFAVTDGLRTAEEQKKLVDSGASQTMNSRHLTGHAVDLVPYIHGKVRWEWPPIFTLALAVRQAAKELKVPLRWGAAWDTDFTASTATPEELMHAYSELRRSQGKKPFLDGPHFELPANLYPG